MSAVSSGKASSEENIESIRLPSEARAEARSSAADVTMAAPMSPNDSTEDVPSAAASGSRPSGARRARPVMESCAAEIPGPRSDTGTMMTPSFAGDDRWSGTTVMLDAVAPFVHRVDRSLVEHDPVLAGEEDRQRGTAGPSDHRDRPQVLGGGGDQPGEAVGAGEDVG